MDSSSNTDDTNTNSFESPQPHKKRKISSQKSKSIHYSTRSQSNKKKTNTKKRILNNTNSSRNNKNKNNKKLCSIRDKVEPWWIGQRIIVQIAHANNNNKKSKHFNKIGREATIRDYNPNTQLSHIWFETEDNNFENVDLLKLEDWDVPNDKPIHKQLDFVPDNDWIPPKWKMKQRVLVKFDGKYGAGSQFAAFIDGYDPISRRHHINYGDTTEWIWARKERVELFKGKCDNYIEEKHKKFRINRDEVIPPPWNPIPYGLDETFEMGNNMSHVNNDNDNQPMKIFANKTRPRRKLNDNFKVLSTGSKRTSALIKKTKAISLNKLLKSNDSKPGHRISKKRRQLRKHSKAVEDSILYDSGTSISSSSSSSESTFDIKTYQSITDSDNDIRIRKQRTFHNKNNDNKHIQVSVSSNIPKSNNSRKSSTKQPKKKKISLRIPTKRTTKTNNKVSKAQTQPQTLPLHLQHIPIAHSINTISTINTNINNTVSQPIVLGQLQQLPLQSIMPIGGANMNNLPLFIPVVQQQQKRNTKRSNNKSQPKKQLYPRTAIIEGEKWVRHHSKSDRKYYWLLHNDKNHIVDKEWDPWRKHGKKAPWMTSMQKWGKFKDPSEKKEYYYNYETKQSTFKRPKGFESDAEIQYDSAEDNHANIGKNN